MKNLKVLLVLVLICVLLVTGCGKKNKDEGTKEQKLICTISGPTATLTRNFTFDEEGKTLLFEEKTRLGAYSDEEILEEDYKDAQDYCVTINEYKGVNCTATKSAKSVKLVEKIDYTLADEQTLNVYAMTNNYSLVEMKKEAGEYGWTCK